MNGLLIHRLCNLILFGILSAVDLVVEFNAVLIDYLFKRLE